MMDDWAVVTPKKHIVGLVLLSMTRYPPSALTTRLRKP